MLNLANSTSYSESKIPLLIESKTWSRDSYGLFDYECSLTMNSNFNIIKDCMIIRKKQDIIQEDLLYKLGENEEIVGKIYMENKRYFLSNPLNFKMLPSLENINHLQNKIWFIIKSEEIEKGINRNILSNENNFITLKVSDIIRLGRVNFIVTEIKLNFTVKKLENCKDENHIFELIPQYSKLNYSHSENSSCKICLSSSEEKNNPLINLCKCSGSMKFIHFQCLKQWMMTKLKIKSNTNKTVISYYMKSFNCEICKTPYPLKFKYDGVCYEIIDFPRFNKSNYIVLESLIQSKDNYNKTFHIINLIENEKVIIGRARDSDLRINDISVSRSHSSLIFYNKRIILFDLKSKFGTLFLVKNDIELSNFRKLSLQIGRTYFELNYLLYKEPKLKEKSFLNIGTINTSNFKKHCYLTFRKLY